MKYASIVPSIKRKRIESVKSLKIVKCYGLCEPGLDGDCLNCVPPVMCDDEVDCFEIKEVEDIERIEVDIHEKQNTLI